MPDGNQRVVEEHAGAGEAHDGADAGAHVGFVAVDGAFLAGGFGVAEFAVVQAFVGVFQQFEAVRTQAVPT